MIRSGVVGGASASMAELIRLLLHHPDVSMRWVMGEPSVAGLRLDVLYPSLTGETELTFCDVPQWESVDVVFLCDDVRSTSFGDVPQDVKVIDMSRLHRLQDERESGFAYGMPEVNRRRLVHDCTRAVCPGGLAMALSLALIPLGKNLMLNSELHATAVVGDEQALADGQILMCDSDAYSDQIVEVERVLGSLQASFGSPFHLTVMRVGQARGMLVTVYFKSGIDTGMVRELFERYYDDHNFTFVVEGRPRLTDVTETNKCLLGIDREGDYLRITSVIDHRIKGGVGNAIHLMNLMFGLHERVGLML